MTSEDLRQHFSKICDEAKQIVKHEKCSPYKRDTRKIKLLIFIHFIGKWHEPNANTVLASDDLPFEF